MLGALGFPRPVICAAEQHEERLFIRGPMREPASLQATLQQDSVVAGWAMAHHFVALLSPGASPPRGSKTSRRMKKHLLLGMSRRGMGGPGGAKDSSRDQHHSQPS